MAIDFATAKVALDEIAGSVARSRRHLSTAKVRVTQEKDGLDGIPTQYGEVITWIDQQAAANPGNAALQALKAERDALQSAFVALRTIATNMEADLASYEL